MSVPVECPSCRHLFYVPDEYVGRKGKCPKCANIFRAEAQEVETFPTAAPDALPVMPVVSSGGKKTSPPAPKSPALSDSSEEIPTFVTLASKPPASKSPPAAKQDKVVIRVPEPKGERKPADSGELASFEVLPPSGQKKSSDSAELPTFAVVPASKGNSAKTPSAKPAAKSSPSPGGALEAVSAGEQSQLPKGEAKPASGSSLGLPAIDVGAPAAKPGSGVRPASGAASPTGPVTAPAQGTPQWIPIAAIGGAAVVAVVGFIIWSQMGGKPTVATPTPAAKANPAEKGTIPAGKKPETIPAQNPVTARTPDPKAIAEAAGKVEKSLVFIEAFRKDQRTEGLGTVIDERGWIATAYELVSGADRVRVHFFNRMAVDATGTVAVDSQHGLAVFALAEPLPADVQWRPVAPASTLSATQIVFPAVAASSRPALKDTMVIAFQKYGELDFTVQKSLGGDLRRDIDLAWIKHDTPVAPADNGGGLFDATGNLVGIRLPLSGANAHGYAIPAKHLDAMLRRATEETTPFDPSKIAKVPDPPVTPLPPENPAPVPNPTPDPTPPATPAAADMERRTKQLARLQELIKTGDARRFSADSPEQYAELREIADLTLELTLEAEQEGFPEGEKARLEAGRDAALEALGDFLWPEEIATTNKQMLEGIKTPGRGVFAYIEIIGNQDQLYLAKVIGTDELLAFNAKMGGASIGAEGRFLIVGRHNPNSTVSAQIDGMEKRAFVVSAKHLISKPLP